MANELHCAKHCERITALVSLLIRRVFNIVWRINKLSIHNIVYDTYNVQIKVKLE